MKRWLESYFESIRNASNDLSFYWFVHLLFILVAVVSAKTRAVYFAYEKMDIWPFTKALLHVLPYDLLFVSALAILILLSRKLPSPPTRMRWVLFVLAPVTALLCSFLAHFNFGYYSQMGEPLSAGLLAIAPHMAGYLLPSVNIESVIVLVGILLVFLILLATTPLLIKSLYPNFIRESYWTLRPIVYTAIVAFPGIFLLTRPALGIREVTLREMTVPTMFVSLGNTEESFYSLDDKSRSAVLQLCGPVDNTGKEELAGLPRRPYNIVIWVLESTGIRFVKSMHPLGYANTPNLDKAIANGAVRFDSCYSQCALSVQSGWAMLTGSEPIPYPTRFVTVAGLPSHEPQITTVLKEHKYNTAVIIGGPSAAWGLDKIAKAGSLDCYEDLYTLKQLGFEALGWGIEGKAINKTFLNFIDSKPGEPFFGLLWQVESHHPYRYLGMPPEETNMRYLDRYPRSIEHVDRLFGDFYEELRKRNLLNDTIIVVIGDHGEGMGRTRPFDVSHSHHVYEDDIHVPLFILHPALKESKRPVQALCAHKDIAPTILDLCGFPTNPAQLGISLAQPIPPRPLFARSQKLWPMSVRAGDYKLILGTPQAVPELFDLKKDPLEQRNLAEKNKNIADLLSAAIREQGAKLQKPLP